MVMLNDLINDIIKTYNHLLSHLLNDLINDIIKTYNH